MAALDNHFAAIKGEGRQTMGSEEGIGREGGRTDRVPCLKTGWG